MDISAKTKEHPEVVTAQYDLPESLEGLVEKFGAETVASNARGAIVISIQAFMRRHIDKPLAELQEIVTAWRPDTRTPAVKKTAFERASSALGSLSAEERAELLKKLQAS
jgi:hypothetical protein